MIATDATSKLRVACTRLLLMTAAAVFAFAVHGHGVETAPETSERAIQFPDTATHQTLVVDLHTHSVFSDGHVWPRVRVAEALRDGLHALAITEHLEYQPHLADIPHPDRNRAYQEAAAVVGDTGLIVIAGAEITREAPAGHINAIFVMDANQLLRVDNPPADRGDTTGYYRAANVWPVAEALQAADDQGAFVFWNHPFWGLTTDGVAEIDRFHRRAARDGLLHGIEVANGPDYSEAAFQIALDHDLAVLGVSDVHGLIDWDYEPHNGGHRPVTLVFATERTGAGIREALFARRTVAWFKDLLIGRADVVDPLIRAILRVTGVETVTGTSMVDVTLTNSSNSPMTLRNSASVTFAHHGQTVVVPPLADLVLRVRRPAGTAPDADLALRFEVSNAYVEPRKHARISFDVATPAPILE